MVIGLDVDEVIAQLHAAWLARYNALYGDNVRVDHILGWDIQNYVRPECGLKIFDLLTPDLYDSDEILPYPDARRAVDSLRMNNHQIVYVTSCGSHNQTAEAKLGWLRRHGFFRELLGDRFIPGQDKSRAPVEMLVDDHAHNVRAFENGVAILVSRPHNEASTVRAPRVNSLGEFADILWNQRPLVTL